MLNKTKVFIPVEGQTKFTPESPLAVVNTNDNFYMAPFVKETEGYFLTESEFRAVLSSAFQAGKEYGADKFGSTAGQLGFKVDSLNEDEYINSVIHSRTWKHV